MHVITIEWIHGVPKKEDVEPFFGNPDPPLMSTHTHPHT